MDKIDGVKDKVANKVEKYTNIINNYNNKFFDMLISGWSFYEILLNLFVILLIIIISSIIYWDSINRRVSKNSRCKKQMDIYDKNKGEYVVSVKNNNSKPLYDVRYNIDNKSVDVICACNEGEYNNSFENIPVRDIKNNKDRVIDKNCKCDKYYNYNDNDSDKIYDGEPGIVRYMMKQDQTDFFDLLDFNMYKNK